MKVMAYSYSLDRQLQYLYVDDDFEKSKFPSWITALINGRTGKPCSESVLKPFGPKGEIRFKEQGYLDPGRIVHEYEGAL